MKTSSTPNSPQQMAFNPSVQQLEAAAALRDTKQHQPSRNSTNDGSGCPMVTHANLHCQRQHVDDRMQKKVGGAIKISKGSSHVFLEKEGKNK